MDRDLLELAIRARGGMLELAAAMHHDVPAIDWWRRKGVPKEMRGLVADMAGAPADSAAEGRSGRRVRQRVVPAPTP